jgi:hypothetical protein
MNPTYYEVTVEGSHDLLKGFVIGFLEGRGISGETFFGDEYELDEESPLEVLFRMMRQRDESTTVIVEAGLRSQLREALQRRKDSLPLKVVSVREVRGATFGFSVKTYSREVGQSLRELFTRPPEGVSVDPPFFPEEIVIPEGKGVEAYAPLHEYEMKWKGQVSGPIRQIFALYHRVGRFEVVRLGDLNLDYGERIL